MKKTNAIKPSTSAVGEIGSNGTITHRVLVQTTRKTPREVTFTQHTADRFTVTGMASTPGIVVSIEKRGPNDDRVRVHDSSALHRLAPRDQWIARLLVHDRHYGALAFGTTPDEAYTKIFKEFGYFGGGRTLY